MKVYLVTCSEISPFHCHYAMKCRGEDLAGVALISSVAPSPLLKEYCNLNKIALGRDSSPNREACLRFLGGEGPDLLVLDVTTLVGPEILRIPKIGTLNIHAGILPKYRGFDARRWAILDSGPVGCTVHFVDEGCDTGPIILTRETKIEPGDTVKSLARKNYFLNKWQALCDALEFIESGRDVLEYQSQFEADGKRHYWMHPKLRAIVGEVLKKKEGV